MKVLERVLEQRLRKVIKIDDIQSGFMSGRSTTDALFAAIIVDKHMEKKTDVGSVC